MKPYFRCSARITFTFFYDFHRVIILKTNFFHTLRNLFYVKTVHNLQNFIFLSAYQPFVFSNLKPFAYISWFGLFQPHSHRRYINAPFLVSIATTTEHSPHKFNGASLCGHHSGNKHTSLSQRKRWRQVTIILIAIIIVFVFGSLLKCCQKIFKSNFNPTQEEEHKLFQQKTHMNYK